VIKLDVRKYLQDPPRSLHWTNFMVTRILTRDLFAEANLLVLHSSFIEWAFCIGIAPLQVVQ